jgi:signal transduction histidine kinase
MKIRQISAAVCGAGLLAAFALMPQVVRGGFFRTAAGDLVPLAIIAATVVLGLRNALDSRGYTRLFWSLITLGMAMWCLNLTAWAWFEVWQRRDVPDPNFGDIILFLHVVPIMAAVLVRPRSDSHDGRVVSGMLNIGMLLVWWMVLYAVIVFPDEYVVINRAVFSVRWDALYLLEGLMLIALSGRAFANARGAWRKLHRNLLGANVSYSVASVFINAAIRQHTYKSGGIWDVPFLASALCFFWMTLAGRCSLSELGHERHEPAPDVISGAAPYLARMALLSLPCMGYWALFMSDGPARVKQVRFEVAIGGAAVLMFFVFLKQHLLDRRLMHLLTESRNSYENLQRLQGRVIQQEKLASLGELVSLAASELQYPLSAVLHTSELLASSSHLKADQLSTARKIGQQARRTRDLVIDLLSFAQQVPGEKISLEVKPLVQRALQMEGFKLDNRDIRLSLESEEFLPRVLGNGNQLLQAFLQIIENAIEALQEVGKGRLLITIRRENKDVVIEFMDDGPGLKNPERVFDPFYTTKPVGKGTGLGLSATYGVIRDHKGQITCHNRPEGGAVFEVRLPGRSEIRGQMAEMGGLQRSEVGMQK